MNGKSLSETTRTGKNCRERDYDDAEARRGGEGARGPRGERQAKVEIRRAARGLRFAGQTRNDRGRVLG